MHDSSSAPLALVTGGAGYFGTRLVERLHGRGYRCRVLDLNDMPERPDGVEVLRGDIRDAATVRRACAGVGVVHHNVAQVPLARDRELFESVNRQGTENLLEASRAAGVQKVVVTSSSAVFGVPDQNPVREDMSPTPREAYGAAKREAELLCQRYAAEGLDVSIIRPRTILGHGRLGIFQILFEWVRCGSNIPVLGAGHNLYQFVHADDLAEACMQAGERAGPETYHCGAARFGTIRQTLEALCAHAGTGSQVRSVPFTPAVWCMQWTTRLGLSPLGPYHALMYGRSMYFDISKAREELGWEPQISNQAMMIESYEWYLAHRDRVLAAAGGSPHQRAVRHGALNLLRWVL